MNFNAVYNTVLKESIILQYKNSTLPSTNSHLTPTHTLSQPNKSRKHSIQKPGVSIVSLESQNTVKKKKTYFGIKSGDVASNHGHSFWWSQSGQVHTLQVNLFFGSTRYCWILCRDVQERIDPIHSCHLRVSGIHGLSSFLLESSFFLWTLFFCS